jgi:beta-N-acetylhexosaminidase
VEDGGAPIDAAIEALSAAALDGRWQPRDASEERRRALLPAGAAEAWDDLMVDPRYMQALTLIDSLPG